MALTNGEKQKRAKERRRALVQAAKSRPCADCGIQYPYWIMQLDHVSGEKLAHISHMVNRSTRSIAELQAEIAKCEVVCANCHADRTFRRRNA